MKILFLLVLLSISLSNVVMADDSREIYRGKPKQLDYRFELSDGTTIELTAPNKKGEITIQKAIVDLNSLEESYSSRNPKGSAHTSPDFFFAWYDIPFSLFGNIPPLVRISLSYYVTENTLIIGDERKVIDTGFTKEKWLCDVFYKEYEKNKKGKSIVCKNEYKNNEFIFLSASFYPWVRVKKGWLEEWEAEYFKMLESIKIITPPSTLK